MVSIVYFLTELMFVGEAVWSSGWLDGDRWNEKRGGCYYGNSNSTENNVKLCKEDFGLLGWKQWTSDKEESLMEQTMFKIVNPEPQKIIIIPEDYKGTLDLKP